MRGFTLIELAVGITIIALLIGTIFIGGGVLVRQAESKAAVKQVADIRAGVRQFQERYHFLPGDFPVTTELQNVDPACVVGGAGAGNGDGLVALTESACALEHLRRTDQLPPRTAATTKYGAVMRILSRTDAVARYTAVVGGPPLFNVRDTARNVILFEQLPCFIALSLDEALDDNVLNNNTGLVASLSGSCTVDTAGVWMAIAL